MSNTPRIAALTAAIVLAALTAGSAAPAHGASFTVNANHDAADTAAGDGVCADAGGACTLRAAVDETNALPGPDTISVPAGTYGVVWPGLSVEDAVTISGAGSAATILQPQNPTDLTRVVTIVCKEPRFQAEFTALTIRGGSWHGGAGIDNWCQSVTLRAVTVRDNGAQAGDGGGIKSGSTATVTIIDSAIVDNSGQAGGAIYSTGALYITNSTLSGNTAAPNGASVAVAGGSARIVNSTITGGWEGLGFGGVVSVELSNSILAANSFSNCVVSSLRMTSLGHNLSSDDSCNLNGPGDLNNTEPQLTGLQNNGGPTLTHGLYPGSPAIDAGDNNGCPAADQRGVARPQGAACDIGAYEYVAPATRPPTEPPTEAPPPPADSTTATPTPGATLRPPPTPSPSPSPAVTISPSERARRLPRPPTPGTAVLIDADYVEEEPESGAPLIASGLAAAGVLGLIGSAGGGFYWYRKRRRRR